MKKFLCSTFLVPTAMELAAGRFMRAPDHPTGGEGGTPTPTPTPTPAAEPEPTGQEVNDPIEDPGTPAAQPSGSVEDDSEVGDGPTSEEGANAPKSADERLTALEERLAAEQRDREYWQGRANGTIDENGNPIGQPPADEGTIPADDADRPKPEDYHYGETDAKYIADLARYETKKAIEEENAAREVRDELANVERSYGERVATAKERYNDYDEVVIKGADPDPVTKQPKWFASPLMCLGIKTSPQGPDIAYYLAKNPEESLRIAQLAPIEQAKEFGRLEYRMELESGSGSGNQPRRVSGAQPPPRTTRGGSGGKGEVPADTDDFGAFEESVDSRKKARRR
jgi:hypothetical protein